MKESSEDKPAAGQMSLPPSPAGEMPGVEDSLSLKAVSPVADLNDRRLILGVCVFLAAIVWVVFGQTLHHGFVNFDDDLYVYDNPVVQKGLTWEGFRWALAYGEIGHWHPLTWLSHMLDCQLYGLKPGGHHLTNVLLHTATAILLFLVLRRMTGYLWRSAFVAAVFAIHPLRVESVAWVAERKDVLSGLFFMLTLWAYVRYAQGRSSVGSRESSAGSSRLALNARRSTLDYFLVLFFYALGLLSKNMLVTLPLILLLLDYWPLNRLSGFAPRAVLRLVAEKIPLLVLTVGSCVATALVPEKITGGQLPFGLRLENAVVSYVIYLWQMIYPLGLASVYPNPMNWLSCWEVAGAAGLLLGITGGAWMGRRRQPWLAVGWLWYVGMLVPVIGVVQISYYAHADRYTYLPQIGLDVMLAWGVANLCAGWRHRNVVLGGLSAVILAGLMVGAHRQAGYWRDSELLWRHTLACTSDNFVAHNNLGNILLQKGGVDEAIAQYQMALRINPGYAEACYNLGNGLCQKGRVKESAVYYKRALQIDPGNVEARYNLGNIFLQTGDVDEAITQYQSALQITPDNAEVHLNLGNALLQKGREDEAIACFEKALQIKPDYAEAHFNLGNALFQKGKVGEAVAHYQSAFQIKPDSPQILNNLAWLRATSPDAHIRDGVQAVKYAGRACELTHYGEAPLVGTLAAAYAEAGRYEDAIAAAEKACALAERSGETNLLQRTRQLLMVYQSRHPYHEAAEKVVPAAPQP